jgi:hypothetical protein
MKTFSIFCLCGFLTLSAFAQTPTIPQKSESPRSERQERARPGTPASPRSERQPPQERQELRQRVQAHRVAFFTERMALTPAEAEKFWPLYNAYINERERLISEIVQRTRPRGGSGERSEFDASKLSDAEAKRLVDNKIKQFDLERKFHNDLTKMFSSQRVLAFYDAEHSFQREMVNMRTRVQVIDMRDPVREGNRQNE